MGTEQADGTLKAVLAWARYAEAFTYSAEAGVFESAAGDVPEI